MEHINSLDVIKGNLGIDKWSEFKPTEMIPQLISLYSNTDSDVIIESFKQFPALAGYFKDYFANEKETSEKMIDANKDEAKNILAGYDFMINAFSNKLNDDNVPFEEKKYYVDMMFKAQEKKVDVKINDQKWLLKLKEYGLYAGGVALAGVLLFFGKNIDIKNIKFKK